ncbi:MAG: SMC-Scp complex subunit ScpB [Acidobacteria bacterium]|nr:SMC-Scp complex subunit ScpB [Acidobacteriota bacterium]
MSTMPLDARIEALLFVADEPVTLARMQDVLDCSEDEARRGLSQLESRLSDSSMMLAEIGGGFRLETKPEFADDIREFLMESRKSRLSLATLESLALIAYKQPITAVEIAEMRMVTSVGSIVKNLLEKKLIRMLGRRKVVGRPMMYGTTRDFLIHFGLNDLSELPSLEEFKKQHMDQVELALEDQPQSEN